MFENLTCRIQSFKLRKTELHGFLFNFVSNLLNSLSLSLTLSLSFSLSLTLSHCLNLSFLHLHEWDLLFMSICLDLCSDKIGELWTERERVRDSENYGEIAEMRERARVCDQDRERERESPNHCLVPTATRRGLLSNQPLRAGELSRWRQVFG